MVHCKIHLENNDRGVYYAGQMLKGTIEMFLEQPKKFRGLYFIVNGRSKCHWTETRQHTSGTGKNRRTTTQTIHFNGKENYLNQRTYLFGADGATPIEVPSGTHRYEFACQLPVMLPASFEASHGNIRYSVETVLDVPWGFDKEFKLQFTIIRNDDLNLLPELKMPCKNEEIKRFCCLFCESDPFIITATIPMSGFVPGQIIPVTVTFDNKSDVDCGRTKINLKRIIRYNSSTPQHKTKIEADKMVEVYGQGSKGGSSTTFVKELEIPHIILCSNSRYCNVVQITYELKVEAEIDGCHRNIELLFPITIGSVPITSNQPRAATAPYVDNPDVPQIPRNVGYIAPPPTTFNGSFGGPTAPMDDPPTFEEATKMENNQEEGTTSKESQSAAGWKIPTGPPSAPAE